MVNESKGLLCAGLTPMRGATPVEWRVSRERIAYDDSLALMQTRAAQISEGGAPELAWLLEHDPLYTAGTSAGSDDLVEPRFPVHQAGRGGQFTYHGPGQRVVYLMLDLRPRGQDVRCFVSALEQWIIATLAHFTIRGEKRGDRIGVWVARPDKGPGHEDKIAAIGLRVRRWVTLHGISLNIEPDLSHFDGIVACGVRNPKFGVTSLVDLGLTVTMEEVDAVLRREFEAVFGPTEVGAMKDT